MGNNVIHLADWAVPSYRRQRVAAPRPAASASSASGAWSEMARQRVAQRQALAQDSGQRTLALVPSAETPPATPPQPHTHAVRVTRPVDARHAPDASGRLRISGRLVDVCAELERLATAEAQAAMHRRA